MSVLEMITLFNLCAIGFFLIMGFFVQFFMSKAIHLLELADERLDEAIEIEERYKDFIELEEEK